MNLLKDAIKAPISAHGYSLLQWDMQENGFYRESHQLPNDFIDLILEWRDKAYSVKFGCIIDGIDDPCKDCVLDADWPGKGINDCDHALKNKYTNRDQCKYWVPIK